MRVILALLVFITCSLFAADADEDWQRLMALDAGPATKPNSAEEARTLSLAHLDAQEKALRTFMQTHSADPRTFQARLRLTRLLALRADLKGEPEPPEVEKLFADAEERIKTARDRADLDFARLNRTLRQWLGKRPTQEERKDVLSAVRRFQQAHPKDSRVAALLVEAATLFEGTVATKEPLLREAQSLTNDAGLKEKIADDLKRISYLGRVLPLRFTDLQGRKRDIKEWRGKPVVLLFFATESEPARQAFAQLQSALAPFGSSVAFVVISLDTGKDDVLKFLAERKATLPVAWEGRGWNGPLVQAFGINAVPAAWILDQRGAVRTLDALEDPAGLLQQLR